MNPETLTRILEWVTSNILWELLVVILIFLLIKPIQAILISRKILKNNRLKMGKQHNRAADIFVHLWHFDIFHDQKLRIGLINFKGSSYSERITSIGNVSDKYLKKLKLTENYHKGGSGRKTVRVIKNWRNKLVYQFTKLWLIYFHGDSRNYYKDLYKI